MSDLDVRMSSGRRLVRVLVISTSILLVLGACIFIVDPKAAYWRQTWGYAVLDLREGTITIHDVLSPPEELPLPPGPRSVWQRHSSFVKEDERYLKIRPYVQYTATRRVSKIHSFYPNMVAVTYWGDADPAFATERIPEYIHQIQDMMKHGNVPWAHRVPERHFVRWNHEAMRFEKLWGEDYSTEQIRNLVIEYRSDAES